MILVNTVPNPNLLARALARYPIMKIHKSFFEVFWFFWGVGVVRFFSKFRIQSRMTLVNSVPNPNLLSQSIGKISHRENPQVFFWGFLGFFGGWSGPIFFKISDPKQNDTSKQCMESQKCSSKITKVIPSQTFHKCGTTNKRTTNDTNSARLIVS